ncbi:MAG TPA: LuxR C-terminal-related transcriptional regulator [Polyangiaceae bacterium]|nr:LuxR C-terminal-related transcriptional regulator [Polyangiaceae bacterium]
MIVLIVDDAQATDFVGRLSRENIDVRCFTELGALDGRRGAGAPLEPKVVFFDLEHCRGTDEQIAISLRRRFPSAWLVALARHLDAERAARLLLHRVPSLKKPVTTGVLTNLALGLSETPQKEPKSGPVRVLEGTGRLEGFLEAYADQRALSRQQRSILRLHLAGNNDKEIACSCSCSEATVYEHWRRMARKAGGMHKSCVISDFHRFLDGA